MALSSLSISRPVTVLMFYIGVVMLGVIAFFSLSVDFSSPNQNPEAHSRTVAG
jgi:multidrug efflux pump subunit AcrB